MPSFKVSHQVRHSAERMFALVADIERYPEFVPLCETLTVRGRRTGDDGREMIVADMTVGYGPVRETFTSKVTLDPDALRIDVEHLAGPFRFLENHWWFERAGDEAAAVHFAISYEFKSRMLGALMGSMFDKAFARFSDAFEERADSIYHCA